MAEIVEAAYDIHTCHQSLSSLCYRTSATRQRMDPLAKSGIETLNHVVRTLHTSSFPMEHAFHALFDHLHNGDVLPGNQLASSQFVLRLGNLLRNAFRRALT